MDTAQRQSFAAVLHDAMKTSNVTKWKLAQCLNLSNIYLRDVAAGMRVPTAPNVVRMARALNVPARGLLVASIWERQMVEIAVERDDARVMAAAEIAAAWMR